MNYFTPDLYQALNDWDALPDALERLKEANSRYSARLEQIRNSLSSEVSAAAGAWIVNDALISKLRQSDNPKELELVLRCGDLQVGYFDLEFSYDSPEISSQDLKSLIKVASNVRGNRRYGGWHAWVQEIDMLKDGRIEHRMFFHNAGIVLVRCRGIHVARIEKSSRRLQPFPNRYRVGRFNLSSRSQKRV